MSEESETDSVLEGPPTQYSSTPSGQYHSPTLQLVYGTEIFNLHEAY